MHRAKIVFDKSGIIHVETRKKVQEVLIKIVKKVVLLTLVLEVLESQFSYDVVQLLLFLQCKFVQEIFLCTQKP